MVFVRFVILIAAVLALAGNGRTPVSRFDAGMPVHGASLLSDDSHAAKKAIDNYSASSHGTLPALAVEGAPSIPEPTCSAAAAFEHVTIVFKHAHSSRYSGLSPPEILV